MVTTEENPKKGTITLRSLKWSAAAGVVIGGILILPGLGTSGLIHSRFLTLSFYIATILFYIAFPVCYFFLLRGWMKKGRDPISWWRIVLFFSVIFPIFGFLAYHQGAETWSAIHNTPDRYIGVDHEPTIKSMGMSPDGKYLYLYSYPGIFRMIDPENGNVVHELIVGREYSPHPLGRLIASNGKSLQLNDLDTGTVIWKKRGVKKLFPFSPDGKMILILRKKVSTLGDSAPRRTTYQLSLLDAKTGDLLRDLQEFQSSSITSTSFSADNKLVAIVSGTKEVVVWEMASGKVMTRFDRLAGDYIGAFFHPKKAILFLMQKKRRTFRDLTVVGKVSKVTTFTAWISRTSPNVFKMTRNGLEIYLLPPSDSSNSPWAVLDDTRVIEGGKRFHIYSLQSGRVLSSFGGPGRRLLSPESVGGKESSYYKRIWTISPDRKRLFKSGTGYIEVWNLEDRLKDAVK